MVWTLVSGSSGSISCTVARTAPSVAPGVGTAHEQRDLRQPLLGERLVQERLRLLADEVVLAVAGDADHLGQILLAEEAEPLADRVLVGPELLGHRLVDHDDPRRGSEVGGGEAAAAGDVDAGGGEVVGADDADLREAPGAAVGGVLALEEDRAREPAAGQRREAGQRRALDPAEAAHPVEQLALAQFRRLAGQAAGGQVERDHRQRRAVDAGIDAAGVAQAAQEQAGANQRHARQRHLGDDQRVLQRRTSRGWPRPGWSDPSTR